MAKLKKTETVKLEDVAAAADAVKAAVREQYAPAVLWERWGKALVVTPGVPAGLAVAGLALSLSKKTRPWAAVALGGAGVWAGLAAAKWLMTPAEEPPAVDKPSRAQSP